VETKKQRLQMEETAHVDNFFLFSAPKKLNYLNYFFGHKGRAFSIVRVLETQFLHLLKKLLLFVKKGKKGKKREEKKNKNAATSAGRSLSLSFFFHCLPICRSRQIRPTPCALRPRTQRAPEAPAASSRRTRGPLRRAWLPGSRTW
jgi:hypothetical protein